MPMSAPRTRVGQLRRKLRAHNRRVLSIVFLSVVSGVALWLASYFVASWLVLLFLSAAIGPEARMPAHFTRVFVIIGAVVFIAAWIEKRLNRHPRPGDKKSSLRLAFDFLFTPSRLLLSLPDNLAAWQNLTDAELRQAIPFIDRIRAARKFPLHSAPVEIPDDRDR